MQLSSQFVSVGVNRVVNALDWADHGLIAYGGHWIVCIYDPEAAEVVGTLTGHRGQVNCVKWLPQSVNPAGARLLLSGCADADIRLWAWHDRQHSPPWSCLHVLQAHSTAVTSLAVQQLGTGSFLLASTSADPNLQLWHCCYDDNSVESRDDASSGQQQQGQQQQGQQQQELQRRFGAAAWQLQPPVHVGSHIQHCVALTTLPGDPGVVIMATGGTDSAIRLFVREAAAAAAAEEGQGAAQQQQHGAFKLQCQLQGHENWVRSVAFTHVAETAGPGGSSSSSCCNGGGTGQQQQGRVSLLLASAGQDRYGRLWCLSSNPHHASAAASAAAAATANGGAASQADTLRQLITRYAPRPHLTAGGSTFWVTQEALLIGHEDWLHSVTWRPQPAVQKAAGGTDRTAVRPRDDLCLLTVSQDRSMMLWCFDAPSGLWLSQAAVGDAGTSCLGFYGGAFSPSGDQLVAHGFTGALHLWKQQQQQQQQQETTGSSSSSRRGGPWLPRHALGGHCGAVVDLAWGGDGGCLQSVSADQTARLFTGSAGHWFELARTQVHGHDFSCLASIATPASDNYTSSSSQLPCPSLLYVSGSEEKVLRVFEAPQAFLETLVVIRGSQAAPGVAADVAAALAAAAARAAGAAAGDLAAGGAAAGGDARGRALGASVAALGLSNKAVYVGDDGTIPGEPGAQRQQGQGSGFGAEAYNEGLDFVPCAVPAVVDGPPLEEHLSQNTLWPEVQKLYGHGNDVFCVAASPGGRLLASACRAQSAGAAGVWVWEVGSWRPVAQLAGHTLTVTQLEFSHDGRFLLSGSRDRSFSLWRVPAGYQQGSEAAAGGAAAAAAAGVGGFELVVRHKAAHSRIIWGVSWSHDSRCFATGSRDQTVKLWALSSSGQPGAKPAAVLPPLPAGVTALALAPAHVCSAATGAAGGTAGAAAKDDPQLQVAAVGLEDGQVQVWSVGLPAAEGDAAQAAPQLLWASAAWQQHAAAVRRLRWAPPAVGRLCGAGDAAGARALLASCGEDHSVRLFAV